MVANDIIRACNALDSGMHTKRAHRLTPTLTAAMRSFHRRILELAASVASVRQAGPPALGAQTTAKLLKTELIDRYHVSVKSHSQVTLTASFLDEPKPGAPVVDVLSALPWDEGKF